ncbi:hypothetical protein EG329_006481 [Mollisiaceae sp. DMI_Dod_QoI]|nr:hypothetical protein EG329_006481 [Helotiales sp. DMI_Dod_QoI]
MSFSMSQGSQGSGLIMQPGNSFRQYEGNNGVNRRNSAPQIYSAIYSGVDVYEMEVNGIAVMRRRKDSWLNATQILKVAGIEKGKRTKVLEKEILIGEHEKVQGGYGKYQGTWIKFERGLEFCRQYGVEELLRPLLTYDMGQDGGVAGRGGIDTPTKEQAMAAQRKRLYNAGADSRSGGQSGTFFKNISSTASHAVAAISKARFDSPVPRIRNGNTTRPASFSRQSSQQHLGSQESVFPGGSQQSMQSFASADSFTMSGQQDSAYATQFSHTGREEMRNGDFEEPPRKRIRPSPSMEETQQGMDGNYYGMSIREASPTEPNDSFVYHTQYPQGDGIVMPLPPLPMPTGLNGSVKRELLMTLFTNEHQTDFSKHKALVSLTSEELDTPIDASCNTALIWAATLGRRHLLKALIARGASMFRVNSSGETALMRSCLVTNNLELGSFPEILELLGPSIEIRDTRGRTVLHHIAITSAVKGRSQASKYHLETLLEFVVRQGSQPNSQQSFTNGPPALKTLGIGRFMSEVVNIQDRSGDTALNIAARIGNRSIISQLLEVGADASIANRCNLSPMDFGVGDPTEFDARPGEGRGLNKGLGADAKESSSEIISSITTLLTETETEFTKEMEKKQSVIDELHSQLRLASGDLGEQRRRLEGYQAELDATELRKLKTANLERAYEEERARLSQMQGQYSQMNGEVELQLGDADKGYTIPEQAGNILSRINPHPHQPLVISSPERQTLSNTLPPAHVLRARVNAYKANNQALEESVRDLQSKSSELAGKYRQVISLCTGVEETSVDNVLDNLLRAVDSEQDDVELVRVREFLQRVEGA